MDNITRSIYQNYELERKKILYQLTKEDLRQSRMLCEPQLKRFDLMLTAERDHVIFSEVMAYGPYHPDVPPFDGADSFNQGSFLPTQRIDHAFRVFEYILIADKMSIVPCGSKQGQFWTIYFEDVFIGVGSTIEIAICKAAIVTNNAIINKLNAVS